MNIVIVGPSYPYRGGISHYTSLLSRHLARAHDVRVVTFTRMYPSFLFPGTTQYDWDQRETNIYAERLLDSLNPLSWIRLAARIRSFSPDLVIFQWWQPFFGVAYGTICLLLRLLTRTRILFLCHNVIPHEQNVVDRLLLGIAFSPLVDCYIVHSGEDERNLLTFVKNRPVRRTFHPTYDVFTMTRTPPEEARKNLGLKGKIILFFGYIRSYKGLPNLLKALPLVLEEVDATLLIVGECYEDRSIYDRLIEAQSIGDRVVFLDRYVPNEEVGLYFSAADVVVLPYREATQSGIIQIAFGFGVPVITTDVGGLGEVVRHGKTGFVVPPDDPRALADAVTRFYMEEHGASFSKNIMDDRDRFSWERLVETVEELASGG